MNKKTKDFLIRHGFDTGAFDMHTLAKEYAEEMKKGLDGTSSLAMLPSFITLCGIQKQKEVFIIDAGGTHLRSAKAMISKNGDFELLSEINHIPTPGTLQSCTAEEFFMTVCDMLKGIKSKDSIAFSFSFPAEITPDLDAKVLKINKELRLYGMQGLFIGKELKKALLKKGVCDVDITVLNDSVATCLAGVALNAGKFDTFTGTIVGTGTNSCYFEKAAEIPKVGQNEGEMIINIETGSYDKTPQNDIDRDFCTKLSITGCRPAEMQISGGYLGALFKKVLEKADSEGVLKLVSDAELKTQDIDDLLREKQNAVSACVSGEDIQKARDIAKAIIKRAAFLSALQLAAMAEKTGSKSICMMMEGTTYHKMHGFKEETEKIAKKYFKEKGIKAEITHTQNAVLKGCCIAALMKKI